MNNKNGFTLAELLAVIVIIGILIIIMFPAYIEISNNMKETSLKNTKDILVNNMLEEANKKYLDAIKPSGIACVADSCSQCFSVNFIINNQIFQTTDGKIINPQTNRELEGYVKLIFDMNTYKLKGEFVDLADSCVNIYG